MAWLTKEKWKVFLEKTKAFFLKTEIFWLLFGVTLMAMAVRFTLFEGESGDYKQFLSKWFFTIQEEGAIKALGREIGDYTPAYFYLLTILTWLPIPPLFSIKALSCLFDILMAAFVALTVFELTKKKWSAVGAYSIILLMPSVFFNSGAWAQCDSIFTAFCVMSVYFLLRKKNITAVVLYGVAFSFKLQAIFMGPLFAVLFFKRKIPLWSPLLIVGVYFLFCIPSWLCGRSLSSLLLVYVSQAGSYSKLTLFATTFVALFGDVNSYHNERVANMLVVLAFTVTVLLIYLSSRKMKWKKESAIDFALLFSLVVPFFLPHMHERYFYLATILSVVYAFMRPNRLYAAGIAEFCSFYVVCNHLYTINYLSLQLVTLLQFANIVLLFRAIWKEYVSQPLTEGARVEEVSNSAQRIEEVSNSARSAEKKEVR